MIDVRNQFPVLEQTVNKKPLVYLDSAATSLKPRILTERLNWAYENLSANVHRGAHFLSDRATSEFENSRQRVKTFLNAQHEEEVIWTSGTTDAINLVAHSFCSMMNEGDEILLTEMEHHSNLVPWHLQAKERKLKIKAIPVTAKGELDLSDLDSLITEKTKIVSLSYCSNVLGTINPIETVIKKAHSVGAKVMVDAAQSIMHFPTDVQALDVDFFAFSTHKMFGPFGLGVLYGKKALLNEMPPFKGGGSMISKVEIDHSDFLEAPQRFEAGTPDIAGVIALPAAIDFIEQMGFSEIKQHDNKLLNLMTEELKTIDGLKFMGESENKVGIVSFNIENCHAADVGHLLNQQGVAVRVGHHCCQPLMKSFGVTSSIRASLSVYNNEDDVERFLKALKKSMEMLT